MVKNYDVRVRVSKDQYERIHFNAQSKGFVRIAPYIRSLCLGYNQFMESIIKENNQILKENTKLLKKVLENLVKLQS